MIIRSCMRVYLVCFIDSVVSLDHSKRPTCFRRFRVTMSTLDHIIQSLMCDATALIALHIAFLWYAQLVIVIASLHYARPITECVTSHSHQSSLLLLDVYSINMTRAR
jgi:hypothetical protein